MLRHQILRSGDEYRGAGESGVALLIVISALVLVLALVSALVLTSTLETRIAASARDDALVLSAATAVASRALVDLRAVEWTTALGGALSTFIDGSPGGTRSLSDGTTIDLDSETSDMQCGRVGGCADGDIVMTAEERPWGPQNPRWRLFAYGPMSLMMPGDPSPPPVYLVAWIADDPTDSDGEPDRDGDTAENPGGGLLLVAGRAYGPGGIQRTVELLVERVGTDLRVVAHHERRR